MDLAHLAPLALLAPPGPCGPSGPIWPHLALLSSAVPLVTATVSMVMVPPLPLPMVWVPAGSGHLKYVDRCKLVAGLKKVLFSLQIYCVHVYVVCVCVYMCAHVGGESHWGLWSW